MWNDGKIVKVIGHGCLKVGGKMEMGSTLKLIMQQKYDTCFDDVI
jgi:hypothetical protein